MPGTLPVPLEIELPQGWQSAPPDEVGAPQAAFVALHTASRGQGFMPNITVSGHTVGSSASLHGLAEESVRRLRENVGPVDVVKRTEVGTSPAPGFIDAPGIVQNVLIRATVNGEPMELAQSQFILLLENKRQRGERVQIEVALTARKSRLQEVLGDFQSFVSTLRPAAAAAGG
ncbi:hypothetical protein [Streptomyces sp. CRN 30]|uniref:hypothetical protein n=1 Tax=Streptomyces sp. CRN 30 TaxID=3075613 RepID=UPI002A81B250|nr:hypothetical protein [Streptomyces sp. CRN 30]